MIAALLIVLAIVAVIFIAMTVWHELIGKHVAANRAARENSPWKR